MIEEESEEEEIDHDDIVTPELPENNIEKTKPCNHAGATIEVAPVDVDGKCDEMLMQEMKQVLDTVVPTQTLDDGALGARTFQGGGEAVETKALGEAVAKPDHESQDKSLTCDIGAHDMMHREAEDYDPWLEAHSQQIHEVWNDAVELEKEAARRRAAAEDMMANLNDLREMYKAQNQRAKEEVINQQMEAEASIRSKLELETPQKDVNEATEKNDGTANAAGTKMTSTQDEKKETDEKSQKILLLEQKAKLAAEAEKKAIEERKRAETELREFKFPKNDIRRWKRPGSIWEHGESLKELAPPSPLDEEPDPKDEDMDVPSEAEELKKKGVFQDFEFYGCLVKSYTSLGLVSLNILARTQSLWCQKCQNFFQCLKRKRMRTYCRQFFFFFWGGVYQRC